MIRRLVSVFNLEVEDAIDFDFHVVAGDRTLLVDRKDLLLQWVVVRYRLHDRDLEVQARLQDSRVFAQAFDHIHVLLWHQDEGMKQLWHSGDVYIIIFSVQMCG